MILLFKGVFVFLCSQVISSKLSCLVSCCVSCESGLAPAEDFGAEYFLLRLSFLDGLNSSSSLGLKYVHCDAKIIIWNGQ